MKKNDTLRLALAATFLALGYLRPFLTGNNRQLGSLLSLMHIPVLLCGFICGWPYGLAVGFMTPLLRSLMIGMPMMLPAALAMAFELAAYGALSGILHAKLPKTSFFLFISLLVSMLLGRPVWGIASLLIYRVMGDPFTLEIFWAAAFATPWPGILLHLVLIPAVLLSLRKARLLPLKG